MRFPVATLGGMIAFVSLAISPATLWAEEKCPSAEACLSKSLDRNWEQYYGVLDRTWAARKKVADLLRKAETHGTSADIGVLKAEQARIEERWHFARAVARALTESRFKNFLAAQQVEAARTHVAAQKHAKKETELYRRLLKGTHDPERNSVIREISSYEHESRELRKTFYRDGLIVSFNSVVKAGDVSADRWVHYSEALTKDNLAQAGAITATVPFVRAMQAMLLTGNSTVEAVHAGLSLEEASRKNHNFEAMLEAMKGTAQFVLHTAELVAQSPPNVVKSALMRESFGPLAARAGIWLNVVSLGLDTLLTVKAVDRLKLTEVRQIQIETKDAHWRARSDAAVRAASDAGAREVRAARQIDHQQRIERLLKKTEEEEG